MIRVAVAVALPGRQQVVELELPEGATVADAIAAAGIAGRAPGVGLESAEWGIWGKVCGLGTPLRGGDRVELLRPLAADAKDQRRERVRNASRRSRSGP